MNIPSKVADLVTGAAVVPTVLRCHAHALLKVRGVHVQVRRRRQLGVPRQGSQRWSSGRLPGQQTAGSELGGKGGSRGTSLWLQVVTLNPDL